MQIHFRTSLQIITLESKLTLSLWWPSKQWMIRNRQRHLKMCSHSKNILLMMKMNLIFLKWRGIQMVKDFSQLEIKCLSQLNYLNRLMHSLSKKSHFQLWIKVLKRWNLKLGKIIWEFFLIISLNTKSLRNFSERKITNSNVNLIFAFNQEKLLYSKLSLSEKNQLY